MRIAPCRGYSAQGKSLLLNNSAAPKRSVSTYSSVQATAGPFNAANSLDIACRSGVKRAAARSRRPASH